MYKYKIMLIFKNNTKYYIYIHIPKNAGKYIRKKLLRNRDNKLIKSYWGCSTKYDLAHIPYIKRGEFIENDIDYNYMSYTRNPYNRIISGFFYKNPKKKIEDFKIFVKETLVLYDFSMEFNKKIIHYYPQYLFLCDDNLDIPTNIKIEKLENCEKPKSYNLLDYYDEMCIEVVNKIYEQDFLLFDYKVINPTFLQRLGLGWQF